VTIVEQGSGSAPQQAAPDLIKETTTQTFVKDVIEESKRQPVLIDFLGRHGAALAASSHRFSRRRSAPQRARSRLVKMNIDEHPAIPGPDGDPVDPGRHPPSSTASPPTVSWARYRRARSTLFIDKVTKAMPSAGEPNVRGNSSRRAEAVLWRKATPPTGRANLMPRCWAADPTNNRSGWRGSPNATVATGAIEQGQADAGHGTGKSKRNDPAVKAVQAALDLAEQAKAGLAR